MRLRAPAIAAVGLIALIGVAGQWLGEPLSYAWRALGALLLLGLALEYLGSRAVRLTATLAQQAPAYLGHPTPWTLRITNSSSRALQLRCQPVAPIALAGTVPEAHRPVAPGAQIAVSFALTPQELGSHRWPRQPVELRGVLRLASWIRQLPLTMMTTENPATTEVEPAHLQQDGQRAAMDRQGTRSTAVVADGGTEFRSLRHYVSGDAPSRIDWKSTARTGRLTVREMQTEQQLLLYFLIDCGRASGLRVGALSNLGHAANLTARMAELAQQAGDRFGLLTYADQPLQALQPGRGPAHLRKLRSVLTAATAAGVASNPLSAVLTASRQLPQRALIVVLTQLDDAEAAGQLAQATALLRPQHLPLIVTIEDDWIRRAAGSTDAGEIFTGIAAREHQRTALATRTRLERLGALVIESPPAQVESRVFARYRQLRRDRTV